MALQGLEFQSLDSSRDWMKKYQHKNKYIQEKVIEIKMERMKQILVFAMMTYCHIL